MSDLIVVDINAELARVSKEMSRQLSEAIYGTPVFKFRKLTVVERLIGLEQRYLPKHDRFDSWKQEIRDEVECDC